MTTKPPTPSPALVPLRSAPDHVRMDVQPQFTEPIEAFKRYFELHTATDHDLRVIQYHPAVLAYRNHTVDHRLLTTVSENIARALLPLLPMITTPLITLVAHYAVSLTLIGEAVMYEGTNKDWSHGFALCAHAMLSEDGELADRAMYQCAQTFMWGMNTVKVDRRTTVSLLSRAQAYDEAYSLLAQCIANGEGVIPNELQGKRMLFDRSDCYSRVSQSIQYHDGYKTHLTTVDPTHGITLYQGALAQAKIKAERGEPRALRVLSRHYLGRWGAICAAADPEHKSATRGITMVGTLGSKSDAVFLDRDLAIMYLKQLAARGSADGMMEIRRALGRTRTPTDEDVVASMEWSHKAALQGYGEAMSDYGYMVHWGYPGHAGDASAALLWYLPAAMEGDSDALRYLAYYYHSRRRPRVDRAIIRNLIERCTLMGSDDHAMQNMLED